MPQDGDLCSEESFNAFLAGFLLKKRKINNFEFFHEMSNFEKEYNVTIVSSDADIVVPIYLDDSTIRLSKNFDDEILVNGKCMTVENYLYSVTTPRIRNFFEINNLNVSPKDNTLIKSLFKKSLIYGK